MRRIPRSCNSNSGHKSLVYVSSFSSCIIINELRACSKEVSQHLSKIVLPQSYPEEPRFLKQNLVSITAQLSKLIIFVLSGSSTQWWDSRLSLRGYAGGSHYYAGTSLWSLSRVGQGKRSRHGVISSKTQFPQLNLKLFQKQYQLNYFDQGTSTLHGEREPKLRKLSRNIA